MNNCWIWIHFLLFSILSIQIVHLLKCDSQIIVDRHNDEKLKSIYPKCLRNESENSKQTKSNDKVEFDMNGYDYTSDEYEQGHSSKDNRESNIKAGGSGKDIIRVRRQYQDQRHSRKNNHSDGTRNRYYNSDENGGNNQSDCLIQCIFQEMGLVNSNQFAERNKVISFMLTTANDLEYRDFVISSVDECFHYIEYNHVNDKCEFSKNLADCLTERALVNCDHWDKKNVLF